MEKEWIGKIDTRGNTCYCSSGIVCSHNTPDEAIDWIEHLAGKGDEFRYDNDFGFISEKSAKEATSFVKNFKQFKVPGECYIYLDSCSEKYTY